MDVSDEIVPLEESFPELDISRKMNQRGQGCEKEAPLKRCRNSVLRGTSWCTSSYLNLNVPVERNFLINTTSNYTKECVELV